MKPLFLYIGIAMFVFFSCTEKLPESYGVFISDEENWNAIETQELSFAGNLFNVVCGIKNPQTQMMEPTDEMIVYLPETTATEWMLTRLLYKESEMVSSPFGAQYTELNFWVADKDIETGISPVEKKPGMYRLKTASLLQPGLYALHRGELRITDAIGASGKKVYVFTIGQSGSSSEKRGKARSISQPEESEGNQVAVDVVPAYEEVISRANNFEDVVEEVVIIGQETFFHESDILLEKANKLFNNRDYTGLRKIFIREDYGFHTDEEWNELEKGFRNWFQQAGKIIRCRIIDRNHFWNNDEMTRYKMHTTYEKAGLVTEEMEVVYFEEKFYIRFLGTR